MLKELQEGLNAYGFLGVATKQQKLFEPLFVSSDKFSVTLDEFLDDLDIEYDLSQAKREKEEDTFKFFSDALQEICHTGNDPYDNNSTCCFFIRTTL